MYTLTEANTTETLACLIIDDPLIRPRYGCLDYKKLLEEMKAHDFFTEIAFIPWNYKRSHTKTIQLFAENADRYAICIHGCDHTGNEFGQGSYQQLSELASTALWRMEQHKRLTGLPYDPVIVFPQGRFSSVAMKALKDHGYVAAFNSGIIATDTDKPPAIEFQRPATTIYHDFPLFLRRYPQAKPSFLKDLEWGRPIIIVEHHKVFRDGYKAITDLVDWINGLGKIRWTSLSNIAAHYLGNQTTTNGEISGPLSLPLGFRTKVFLRRILSEARDKYVETSPILTKLYKKVRG